MERPIIGGILAFLVGCGIAAVNAAITKRTLEKNPKRFASIAPLRQGINVAYLVLIFTFGAYLPWDRTALLLGGAIGVTVPSFLFALRLAKQNDEQNRKITEQKINHEEKGAE